MLEHNTNTRVRERARLERKSEIRKSELFDGVRRTPVWRSPRWAKEPGGTRPSNAGGATTRRSGTQNGRTSAFKNQNVCPKTIVTSLADPKERFTSSAPHSCAMSDAPPRPAGPARRLAPAATPAPRQKGAPTRSRAGTSTHAVQSPAQH